jgi:hypothetical protein
MTTWIVANLGWIVPVAILLLIVLIVVGCIGIAGEEPEINKAMKRTHE